MEDSELLMDSLHSALKTRNASLARAAEMSLLCAGSIKAVDQWTEQLECYESSPSQ